MNATLTRLVDLHPDAVLDEQDLKNMTRSIEQMSKQGWLEDEIIAHMLNLEELNPTLDETIALRRMNTVRVRVMERLGKVSNNG